MIVVVKYNLYYTVLKKHSKTWNQIIEKYKKTRIWILFENES